VHFGINYPRAQEWCISQLPRGISPFIDLVPGPPPGLAGLFRCDWLLSRPERRGPPVTSRPSPTLHRVFRSDEIQRMRAGGPQGNWANLTASPANLRRKMEVDAIKGRRAFAEVLLGPWPTKRRRMLRGWPEAAGERPILLPELSRRAGPRRSGNCFVLGHAQVYFRWLTFGNYQPRGRALTAALADR
jgi:hypothetical protein